MNFISTVVAESLSAAEPNLTIEVAHLWRSKIVEKCAEAERHVLRLIRAGNSTWPPRAPLSQKIGCLKRIIDEDVTVIRGAKVRRLLDQLEPLSNLRSELVHSTVSMASVEGLTAAILRNAAEEEPGNGQRQVFNLERFRSCHSKLSNVANSLRQEADHAEKAVGPPLSRG